MDVCTTFLPLFAAKSCGKANRAKSWGRCSGIDSNSLDYLKSFQRVECGGGTWNLISMAFFYFSLQTSENSIWCSHSFAIKKFSKINNSRTFNFTATQWIQMFFMYSVFITPKGFPKLRKKINRREVFAMFMVTSLTNQFLLCWVNWTCEFLQIQILGNPIAMALKFVY